MNAAELKNRMKSEMLRVCEHLLPNGKLRGKTWLIGGVNGEAGKSMVIHVEGDRCGAWIDFGDTSEKGDPFTLWERVRGVDFSTAVKEAKEFFGIADNRADDYRRITKASKTFVRPALEEVQPLVSGGPVYEYLVKIRQLDPEILRAYEVMQACDWRGPAMVFPARDPSGKNIDLLKFLAVERTAEGDKNSWSSKDSKDHLIGWQAVKPTDREITIAEGEIDAYTIAGWGIRALSIPRGVNGMEWIEHDYEALERFERINLCLDMDGPGGKAAQEIAQRLGRERCFRVILPDFKDANEAHCSGRFLGPDFEDCLAAAKTLDPAELRSAGDFKDEAWEVQHPTSQKTIGTEPPIPLPWRCRFGEVSLWSGTNGHGKSAALLHFAMHDAAQGERVCIASLEVPAAKLVGQLVPLARGGPTDKGKRSESDEAVDWLAQRFWIVAHVGVMHWRKLLPILEYAARRYGCTRFIIDSLVRCGIREDDYDEQIAFVGELAHFADSFGHVHLVAHPRKGDDEKQVPGKMDVRGGSGLTDLVANGFTIWRNKDKSDKLQGIDPKNYNEVMRIQAMKDGQITLWKQREGGEEGFRALWLHRPSGQFLSTATELPRRYIKT